MNERLLRWIGISIWFVIAEATALLIVFYSITGIWYALKDSAMISVLFDIPRYYYAGAVAFALISMYLLLRRVAYELGSEDWQSNEAKNMAVVVTGLIAVAIAVIGTIVITGVIVAAGYGTIAVAVTVAIVGVCVGVGAVAIAFAIAGNSKTLLFFGACLHYLRRECSRNLHLNSH